MVCFVPSACSAMTGGKVGQKSYFLSPTKIDTYLKAQTFCHSATLMGSKLVEPLNRAEYTSLLDVMGDATKDFWIGILDPQNKYIIFLKLTFLGSNSKLIYPSFGCSISQAVLASSGVPLGDGFQMFFQRQQNPEPNFELERCVMAVGSRGAYRQSWLDVDCQRSNYIQNAFALCEVVCKN